MAWWPTLSQAINDSVLHGISFLCKTIIHDPGITNHQGETFRLDSLEQMVRRKARAEKEAPLLITQRGAALACARFSQAIPGERNSGNRKVAINGCNSMDASRRFMRTV